MAKVSKKLTSAQNKVTQIRAERNVFGQLVLLAVQNGIDLETTMSFPLGPVPWALATADGMPTKTDKAKLLHRLQGEPVITRPQDSVHIIDGNAVLQSMMNIPETFGEISDHVFNQLPKSGDVHFVTDTYKKNSIKSFERMRRGSTPTFLVSGPKTKTPRDWKGFMSNDKNKTQLINLIFEQWTTQRFSQKLISQNIFFILSDKCYKLSSRDGENVDVVPVEDLFSSQEEADSRIILHCVYAKQAEARNIIVRSPDTDVLVLLCKYMVDLEHIPVYFDTGMGNKRRLLDVGAICRTIGPEMCKVLPALHAFTGCDTISAFVRRGKTNVMKIVDKNQDFQRTLHLLGQVHTCSDVLVKGLEHLVCAMYGKGKYTDVNKLRHDLFIKKYDPQRGPLTGQSGTDMSLLPPCGSSLQLHILRANYQVYIWIHAHENFPNLPNAYDCGWRMDHEGNIDYKWIHEIAPEALINVITQAALDRGEESDGEDEQELENMVDVIYEDSDNDSD